MGNKYHAPRPCCHALSRVRPGPIVTSNSFAKSPPAQETIVLHGAGAVICWHIQGRPSVDLIRRPQSISMLASASAARGAQRSRFLRRLGNQPFDIELYGQLCDRLGRYLQRLGRQGIPRTCDNALPRPPSRPSRDVNLFCYRKGIVDLNAKVSDGTFDHCVAEQKLHGVSRQAQLDRLMVALDFQADLNCLQQQAWQRRGQERRLLGGT